MDGIKYLKAYVFLSSISARLMEINVFVALYKHFNYYYTYSNQTKLLKMQWIWKVLHHAFCTDTCCTPFINQSSKETAANVTIYYLLTFMLHHPLPPTCKWVVKISVIKLTTKIVTVKTANRSCSTNMFTFVSFSYDLEHKCMHIFDVCTVVPVP